MLCLDPFIGYSEVLFKMKVLHRTEEAPSCTKPFSLHSEPPLLPLDFSAHNYQTKVASLLSAESSNLIHYSLTVTMTRFPEANIPFSHAFLYLAPEEPH